MDGWCKFDEEKGGMILQEQVVLLHYQNLFLE